MEQELCPEDLPLYPGQSAIWYDLSVNPESSIAYHIGGYWEFVGRFDPALFVQAARHVANSTAALRLQLCRQDDGSLPFQHIRDSVPDGCVQVLDFSNERDPPVAAREWMAKDVRLPLDPFSFPAFRFAVIKLSPDWHFGYLLFHHIFIDGVAYFIVLRKLMEALGAFATQSAPAPDRDAHNEHRAYITALDEYRRSPEFDLAKRYWEKLHKTPAPRVSLSMRAPRRASGCEAIRIELPISRECIDAFGGIADEVGASITEILFASVVLFVHRMTGTEDIPIGLPVHGRPTALRNSLVWMCMNVLPLRISISGTLGLHEFFTTVVAQFREALLHQSYRYEAMRRDLGRSDGLGLFAISVNVIRGVGTMSRDRRGQPWTTFHSLATGPVEDLQVLIMDGGESPDTLWVEFRGNPAMYDRWELENIAGSFSNLLAAFADQSDAVSQDHS